MLEPQIVLPARQQIPDWRLIFGNWHPLKVEIGPGQGDFLLDLAREEPDANFVAIEIRNKRVEKIKARAARAGVKNAQVWMGDAKEVLPSLFAPGTVDTFFIHFPDPWVKRKHERRRLIQLEFVHIMHTLLVPQGKAYLTTDVANYAEHMLQCFQAQGGFTTVYAESGHRDYAYHHSVHESKFKLGGRTINYFYFSKNANNANTGTGTV